MKKIAFFSEQLPQHLNDSARFAIWHEVLESLICCVDIDRLPDRPFSTRFEFMEVGGLRIGRFEGTMNRLARSASAIARCPDDDFCLMINRGTAAISARQIGREAIYEPGSSVLLSNDAVCDLLANGSNRWIALTVDRERLRSLVEGADDLRAQRIDGRQADLRLLGHYLEGVVDLGETADDPTLETHISVTIADLLALTLGARPEVVETANGRGLRAARLQEVLGALRAGFADPGFSTDKVARGLGLSRRYVNDLLYDTGRGFSERVLELRLQKARTMLASPRNDRLKISEIAFACGFNEVSYFNRRFRARFGASPTQYRAGKVGERVTKRGAAEAAPPTD